MEKKSKKYLLDTNILIEFMCDNSVVAQKIVEVGFDRCFMSVISLHEIYFGAFNAKKKGEKFFNMEIARIEKLLSKLKVLPLYSNGELYGSIKYSLLKKGQIIDEFDMILASHAISEGLTVVTDNLKHFGRIPSLKVENWMER